MKAVDGKNLDQFFPQEKFSERSKVVDFLTSLIRLGENESEKIVNFTETFFKAIDLGQFAKKVLLEISDSTLESVQV